MYYKIKIVIANLLLIMSLMGCSKKITCELVYDAKAGVGEGALWDEQTNRLFWIDITGKILYVYIPETKTMNSFNMPKEIGTIVVIDDSNVLLALADGMYEFNLISKELHQKLLPNIDTLSVRFNDGKCSPDGKLWVGTMHHGVSDPVASLYRVSGDYSIREMENQITVSNGIIWSVDGTKMYYIDSPTYSVVSYDYDVKRGEISNKQKIIDTPKEWGTPDGSTIDADGNLWVAHWGGGKVSKWNPQTGELLDTISVPSPNVTSVAFGGKNKDILYITTAKNWMKPGDLEKYPFAGGLFAAKVGSKGITSYRFTKK